MANEATAREQQSARVYQLPASQAVTVPSPNISAIHERLGEIGFQQAVILQLLRQVYERDARPGVAKNISWTVVMDSASLPSTLISTSTAWSTVGTPSTKDQFTLIGRTVAASYEMGGQEKSGAQILANQESADLNLPSDGVPLSKLLSVGAIALAAFSFTSLATWLIGSLPVVHPVVSVMSLVAAPFIYWMGRAAKLDLR